MDQKTERNIDFDILFASLGEGFGKFQLLVYLLTCLCSFYAGYFIVSPIFANRVLPHRCQIPECEDGSNTSFVKEFLNFSTPWDYESKTWASCDRFSRPNSSVVPFSTCIPSNFESSKIEPCEEIVYDKSEFHSTTSTEFNLVCANAWLLPLEMSCIMAGYLAGSCLIGVLSDKKGRSFGILVSAIALSFGGIAASFAPNYYAFLAFRFIGGLGSLGCYHAAFISTMEYIGPQWRTLCCILLNIPFSVGEMVLGLMAYYIRSWRMLLLANSVPVMLIFSYYWIMPESIRWLMSKNRKAEAFCIVQKVAKINGMTISSEVEDFFRPIEVETVPNQGRIHREKNEPSASIQDLMKSPRIRRRSLILFYCWIVCALMYYGISVYVGSFSGDLFLNFTLVILVELPGYFLSAFASNLLGRKFVIFISFLIGGLACITSAFLPSDEQGAIMALSLLGKFSITAAFGTIYVYSGELFPTSYRAIGIGICSMCGRVGGIMAPFIANLATTYTPLPSLIFGVMSLLASILLLTFLPDTLGEILPQTIGECEAIGENQKPCELGLCRGMQ